MFNAASSISPLPFVPATSLCDRIVIHWGIRWIIALTSHCFNLAALSSLVNYIVSGCSPPTQRLLSPLSSATSRNLASLSAC